MTHAEIIAELVEVLHDMACGDPDPKARILKAYTRADALKCRLLGEVAAAVLDEFDCPWQPPSTGSWRDRPPLL